MRSFARVVSFVFFGMAGLLVIAAATGQDRTTAALLAVACAVVGGFIRVFSSLRPDDAPSPGPGLADASAVEAAPSTGNYFARHWRGELSLGVSYWLNGLVLGNVLVALMLWTASGLSGVVENLRLLGTLGLATIVVSIAITVWGIVGIWRSAGHHVARGGKPFWAGAARLVVVLNTIRLLLTAASPGFVAQGVEFAQLATGHDSLAPVIIKVASDQKSMLLSGSLGEGSAALVKKAVAAAPGIRVLELDSIGGRVLEARQIAKLITSRHLDTYVEGLCVSACTIVLMAGQDRGATPNARIGFHRSSFAGDDASSMDDPMILAYRAKGMSEAFIAHVTATSSKDMWYPEPAELIANHVINRVSMGGETARLSDMVDDDRLPAFLASDETWRAVEIRFPGTTERALAAMRSAKASGKSTTEVLAASRAVLSALMPAALRDAPDPVLQAFLHLMVSELDAAQALGPEACSSFLDGRLNVSSVFPKEVREQDLRFTRDLFTAPARTERGQPPELTQRARDATLDGWTAGEIEAVANLEQSKDPRVRCEITSKLYHSMARLDPPLQLAMLQFMFQR